MDGPCVLSPVFRSRMRTAGRAALALGLSAAEPSRVLGVSPSMASLIEPGTGWYPLDMLEDAAGFAAVLGYLDAIDNPA